MVPRELQTVRLGRVEYEDGLALQRLYGEARLAGTVPDTLLLLEHPPLLTLGRSAKREHILAPPERLAAEGIEVFETRRGGDVTYHGPGQLVGYPIFHLAPDRKDVRRYVRDVEEALLRTLARFGMSAGRIPRWPGVWLGEAGDPDARKIAAIGVHLSRWLTSHGFALNVHPDLSHFGLIVPCGIREAGVTSLCRELGRPVELPEVEAHLAADFAEVFGAWRLPEVRPGEHTVSVAIVRGEQVLLLRRSAARGGFWQLCTGRVEPGESSLRAAAREAREETGAVLAVAPLGYRHSFALGEALPPRLVEEEAFWAPWPEGAGVRLSEEHVEWRWADAEEVEALLTFRGLRRAARLALAAARSAGEGLSAP